MDAPKTLASAVERSARLAMLSQLHIQPLVVLVDRIREAKGTEFHIPYFDPLDGGVDAEILFLLEAPGPKSVVSGFISRNNPDETAKNFFLLNEAAGIERRRTILWNAVPWYIGSGTQIRPAKKMDVREADEWLAELISYLHHLRIVVFVGKKSLHAKNVIRSVRQELKVFEMPHPSPMFINRYPANRQLALSALQQVSRQLARGDADPITQPDDPLSACRRH